MSRNKYDLQFRKQCLIDREDKRYLIEVDRIISLRKRSLEVEEDETHFDAIYDNIRKTTNNIKNDSKLDCAKRLVESRYKRRKRIEKHCKTLVNSGCALFVTLTFTDKTLNDTTREQRRRIIQRYLKDNCSHYVANVDYGGRYGREHYHAIVSNDINLNDYHKYGAIKVQHIRKSEESLEKLSKYISKLTNHALKQDSLDTRLIFSRNRL